MYHDFRGMLYRIICSDDNSMSNQGLLTICSIFGLHSGVNAMITVCFSYLSRCLYKASAGDVCCDDFLVRSETFTSLNVESKDTTCTVCWSL